MVGAGHNFIGFPHDIIKCPSFTEVHRSSMNAERKAKLKLALIATAREKYDCNTLE